MRSRWSSSPAMVSRVASRVAALSSVALLLGCGSQTTTTKSQPSGGDAAQASGSPSPASPGLTQAPDKPVSTVVVPPRKPLPTVRPGAFAPSVVWKRDVLVVTAFGSGTCQPIAKAAAGVDRHTVVVSFVDRPADVACTDDYAPRRSRIAAPTGDIDVSSDVYATFDLEGAPRQLIPVRLVNPVVR